VEGVQAVEAARLELVDGVVGEVEPLKDVVVGKHGGLETSDEVVAQVETHELLHTVQRSRIYLL